LLISFLPNLIGDVEPKNIENQATKSLSPKAEKHILDENIRIDLSLNKKEYSPGESVVAKIIVENNSEILLRDIYINFEANGIYSDRYDKRGFIEKKSTKVFTKSFLIPKSTPDGKFKLHINIQMEGVESGIHKLEDAYFKVLGKKEDK